MAADLSTDLLAHLSTWPCAIDRGAVCLALALPGKPVPKGRPRFARRGKAVVSFTPGSTQAAEAALGFAARHAMLGCPVDCEHDFSVRVIFAVGDRRRRDIDNLVKLIMDGLNGIVWGDDCQVTELFAKVYRAAAVPATYLLISRLPTQHPAPRRKTSRAPQPTPPPDACGAPQSPSPRRSAGRRAPRIP